LRDTSSVLAISRMLLSYLLKTDLHRFLRHQHEALRCGLPHLRMGEFSIGDPDQFCTDDYTVNKPSRTLLSHL